MTTEGPKMTMPLTAGVTTGMPTTMAAGTTGFPTMIPTEPSSANGGGGIMAPPMGRGLTPPAQPSAVRISESQRSFLGTGLTLLQLVSLIASIYAVLVFPVPALPLGERFEAQAQIASQVIFGVLIYIVIQKLLGNLFK